MTTAATLADDLGVSEGDVQLLILALAEHDPELVGVQFDAIPEGMAVEVAVLLDPDGSRREDGQHE